MCYVLRVMHYALCHNIILKYLYYLLYVHKHIRTGGESFVKYGMCPKDKSFPDEDEQVKKLAYAKLRSFDRNTHGQFFWNFRTEFEPRWDFAQAVKKGWLPTDYTHIETMELIDNSCNYESVAPVRSYGSVLTIMASILLLFLLLFIVRNLIIIMKKRANTRQFNYVTIVDPSPSQSMTHTQIITAKQHLPSPPSHTHKSVNNNGFKNHIAIKMKTKVEDNTEFKVDTEAGNPTVPAIPVYQR